jgi:hypothetical protein
LGGRGPSVSVWPSGQGERQAYPRRWPLGAISRQDGDGRRDRSGLVAGGVVAKENSISQMLTSMRGTPVLSRMVPSAQVAVVSKDAELALSVATVYQDPLMRHWATELWDRVGKLIGGGGICHKSWSLSELARPEALAEAVQAAIEADVVVVSIRDTGALPPNLHIWADAWLLCRARRAGCLVALIGVPAQPDAQSGRALGLLETVARTAGLDFLPRERKLPAEASPLFALSGFTLTADLTTSGVGRLPGHNAGASLQTRLTE